MNFAELCSNDVGERIAKRVKEISEDGANQPNAFTIAIACELVKAVNKELASRDDRLRKQASRIRALERGLGIAEGGNE